VRAIRVRLLVRIADLPVAWMWADAENGIVSRESLGRALVEIAPELARAAVRRRGQRRDTSASPPISVVVCTRDRPQSLARCLDALSQLDYPAFEIVVVDNAPPSDASARIAARFPVRYVVEPIPGLDWARNRGIAEARHAIIAFTDDDVRVDRRWLRGIAQGFTNEKIGLVTGFVAPGSLDTEAEQIFELHYGGMGKGFTARLLDPSTAGPQSLLGAHHLGVGANMAVRRAVLDSIAGFDTALDVGTPARGGGDLDLFHRVLLSGALAGYEPSALVWHFHRRTRADLRRQMRDNGRAFGVYLLARFRDGRVPKRAVAAYLARWMSWLIFRVPRRVMRREKMPIPFLLAELWGSVHAPYAYVRTYARDRGLRAGSSS
jgi:glycosyltransferase involved in cell wall biosynthesis